MPGLTVNTTPSSSHSQGTSPHSPSHSRSSSPVRPPYSPITPVLASARLATASTPAARTTYTHSQSRQTSIPQPALESIAFGSNPDALALKSAISILQLQHRNALADIQNLQRIKERALEDPQGFAKALVSGEVKARSDPLFAPSREGGTEDDEDDDEDMEDRPSDTTQDSATKPWPTIPTSQNIVRCPPINWAQYAVVGESLDKLHADQLARPTDGMPQKQGSEGSLVYGGDGARRQSDAVVAAPYSPGKDRIEKAGGKKTGKR